MVDRYQKNRNYNRIHELKTLDVTSWKQGFSICGGNFIAYGHEFAVLEYAFVNMDQKTFKIQCIVDDDKLPPYMFSFGREGTPLQRWYDTMEVFMPSKYIESKFNPILPVTFVVERVEAHNLYHTMCEWYNIFLISKLLSFNSRTADILLLDDRPSSPMDKIWETLYHKIWRRSDLDRNPIYRTLIWNVIGYESPINFHEVTNIDYIDEFSEYFLNAYGINKTKQLDCSNLTATIIWRHDYDTHPERKKLTNGKLQRKFKNEAEILKAVKKVMAGHLVNAVALEQLSMKQQLDLVSQTDILIGMHGAALTHTLFLPKHAAMFEMFPSYIKLKAFNHFKAFARWRGIAYRRWQNTDKKNDFADFSTYVSPDTVELYLNQLRRDICQF